MLRCVEMLEYTDSLLFFLNRSRMKALIFHKINLLRAKKFNQKHFALSAG